MGVRIRKKASHRYFLAVIRCPALSVRTAYARPTGATRHASRYDEKTMPSLQDSVVIFVLALILVGPKNLPKLARQLGKLMAEFRRASNEFRMQMEDELRVEEQKEHAAKVAAMEGPPSERAATPDFDAGGTHEGEVTPQPFPIAESGELKMMPPSTGLPVESASWGTSQPAAETSETAAAETTDTVAAGMSSEEPAAHTATETHTAAETHTEQTHA